MPAVQIIQVSLPCFESGSMISNIDLIAVPASGRRPVFVPFCFSFAYFFFISLFSVGSCSTEGNMIKSEDHDFMHVGSAGATSSVRLLSRSPHNNNTYHGEQLLIHQQKLGGCGWNKAHMHNQTAIYGGRGVIIAHTNQTYISTKF